jgi:hypothetical protein
VLCPNVRGEPRECDMIVCERRRQTLVGSRDLMTNPTLLDQLLTRPLNASAVLKEDARLQREELIGPLILCITLTPILHKS